MKRYYPAIIEKNPAAEKARGKDMRGLFGVIVPDVEGCYSAGDTIEEAIGNAEEALKLHLEALRDAGRAIPEISSADPGQLLGKAGMEDSDIACIAMIYAKLASAPIRLSLTMDPDLVEEIDAVASNRSAFLAEAARAELAARRSSGPRKVKKQSIRGRVSKA